MDLMRLMLVLTVTLTYLLGAQSAGAAVGAALDRAGLQQTFSAEFNDPTGTDLNRHVWRTDYYFVAPAVGPNGRPRTAALAFLGRTISGEKEVYVDRDYCGYSPFSIGDGVLKITASLADPVAFQTCGQGRRPILSGLITTQDSFSQTYGYFEMRAKLPVAQGAWSAFWLVPTQKTPQNAGRIPEFDVMEHWAGQLNVVSQGRPFVIDRTGKPISTLHAGTLSAPQAASNAATVKPIDLSQYHTFGLLWTPDELVWYVDDHETFRSPLVNAEPHYMLINLAVDGRYANPGPFPTSLAVDYVRAYRLPRH